MGESRLSKWLVVISCAAMTVMMILFGLSFLFTPSRTAFADLARRGLGFTPLLFGTACFIAVLCYPLLLSPALQRRAADLRMQLFIFGSIPVLVYFFPTALVGFEKRMVIGTLIFLAICFLFLILPFVLFKGYRRWVAALTAAILSILMFTSAIIYAFMPNSVIFTTFNRDFGTQLVPMSFALLCLIAGLGYLAIMALGKAPPMIRALLFAVMTFPFAMFGALSIYNAVRQIQSFVLPLSLFDLAIIIALIGFGLYAPRGSISTRTLPALPLEEKHVGVSSTNT